MRSLAERLRVPLDVLNGSLNKKYHTRDEYDKTINETQSAFNKNLESSQTLLHVLKKEGAQLYKKKVNVLGLYGPTIRFIRRHQMKLRLNLKYEAI